MVWSGGGGGGGGGDGDGDRPLGAVEAGFVEFGLEVVVAVIGRLAPGKAALGCDEAAGFDDDGFFLAWRMCGSVVAEGEAEEAGGGEGESTEMGE